MTLKCQPVSHKMTLGFCCLFFISQSATVYRAFCRGERSEQNGPACALPGCSGTPWTSGGMASSLISLPLVTVPQAGGAAGLQPLEWVGGRSAGSRWLLQRSPTPTLVLQPSRMCRLPGSTQEARA